MSPMRKADSVRIIAGVSVLLAAIPTAFILFYGFVVFHSALGFSGTVFASIGLTVFSSALAAAIIFIIFTPLAYELSRHRHAVWESVADIPASIPHPIVGIAFLLVGSPLTPLGRFLESLGLGLFNTLPGLVAALVFIAMPIYVRSAQSIFSSRARDPEEFAFSLGASRMRTLYSILVSGSARDVVSSSLTAMSRAMSEYGSVAIIAYSVIGYPFNGVSTASVLIFNDYDFFGPQVAITASALMILFSLAIIVAIRVVNRRPARNGAILHPPGGGRR